MKPIARPIDLNLFRMHLPLPGWVSILHRVSGVLLFVALPLGVWILSVSLSGETGFKSISDKLGHPLTRLVLLGLFWAFVHHLLAGVRHLALDAHCGVDLKRARQSSLVVMLAGGLVTLLVAWKVFA